MTYIVVTVSLGILFAVIERIINTTSKLLNTLDSCESHEKQ